MASGAGWGRLHGHRLALAVEFGQDRCARPALVTSTSQLARCPQVQPRFSSYSVSTFLLAPFARPSPGIVGSNPGSLRATCAVQLVRPKASGLRQCSSG